MQLFFRGRKKSIGNCLWTYIFYVGHPRGYGINVRNAVLLYKKVRRKEGPQRNWHWSRSDNGPWRENFQRRNLGSKSRWKNVYYKVLWFLGHWWRNEWKIIYSKRFTHRIWFSSATFSGRRRGSWYAVQVWVMLFHHLVHDSSNRQILLVAYCKFRNGGWASNCIWLDGTLLFSHVGSTNLWAGKPV